MKKERFTYMFNDGDVIIGDVDQQSFPYHDFIQERFADGRIKLDNVKRYEGVTRFIVNGIKPVDY